MKLTRLLSSLFVLTLCLVVLASASFAKSKPLDNPLGLAVDAAGNLYVANEFPNQILIYNSAYVQQTSKTITAGIDRPFGVAIDPYGNLWVSNVFGNNITEYVKGVQNTSATITNGISLPTAIAIDGLDNLWVVNNNQGTIDIYAPTAVYAPPSNPVRSNGCGFCLSVAVGAGAFVYGTETTVPLNSASATLLGSPLNGGAYSFGGQALAADNMGNIYIANSGLQNNNVYFANPNGSASVFVTLPFQSVGGMAVDNVKKRVYISDTDDNEIYVYSTAGALLKMIHN